MTARPGARGRSAVGAALVAVLLAAGAAGCSADSSAGHASSSDPAAAAPRATVLPSQARSLPLVQPIHVGATSVVARAVPASVPVYRTPTDGAPWMTLKNPEPSGAPLVFLVQAQRDGWLRVLLPVRPNQAQGWVHRSDVTLFQHDYRMVISISRHTLTVYRGSAVQLTEPVGLGTATTPTPGGVFYTMELLKPSDPKGAYGPYAFGLSGFSTVLTEFMGGDGRIGIHGTDDPAGLGKNVSHGCIRVRNAAIERLARTLPLGVPVQIER
ncbi:MAG TPA: L,D-transpeptidase [Kineosporiaceae bacterium]